MDEETARMGHVSATQATRAGIAARVSDCGVIAFLSNGSVVMWGEELLV